MSNGIHIHLCKECNQEIYGLTEICIWCLFCKFLKETVDNMKDSVGEKSEK